MSFWIRNSIAPLITNDGVTIAKDVELEDPFENMGAQLVKEVATKTNDVAGDGTTTATLLAQAIIREGLKNVAAGANPMVVKKGIDKAVNAAVTAIKGNSTTINGKADIAQVAANSAADADVGELIADAMDKVSKDGVITLEEAKLPKLIQKLYAACSLTAAIFRLTWQQIRRRWKLFLTTRTFLLQIRKFQIFRTFSPVLEQIVQQGKKLLIIAEDVEGEALATILLIS